MCACVIPRRVVLETLCPCYDVPLPHVLQAATPVACAGVICIAIGTGFLAIAAVFILVFRNSLGYLFVDSANVAAVVASICPIAATYQIPDGVLGTIGGVLRYVNSCQSCFRG